MSTEVKRRFQVLCKVLLALSIQSLAAPADAVPRLWVGPVGPAPWSIPVFWSPPGLPGMGDDVFITPTDNMFRHVLYDYVGPPVLLNSLTIDNSGGPGGVDSVPLFFSQGGANLAAVSESIGNSLGNSFSIFAHTGGVNSVGVGGLSLGVNPGNFAIYDLNGGTLTVNGDVYVGGSISGAGGVGNLGVSSGTLTTGGTIVVYDTLDAFFGPSGITLTEGTINAAALNFNGMPSLFDWTGGTLNITNNVTFDSAADGTTTSAAFGTARIISTGQTLEITGYETLGGTGAFDLTINGGIHTVTGGININNGSLTVSGGGTATGHWLDIGAISLSTGLTSITGPGSSLHVSTGLTTGQAGHGSLIVNDGGTATADNWFAVGGSATGIGTVTVGGTGTGATISGGFGTVAGWSGQGTIHVNAGGTLSSPSAIYLGFDTTGDGTINVNNGGMVSAATEVFVGGYWDGPRGKGVLNVSGGTLTADGTIVAYNTTDTQINLSNGTMNAAALNFNGTPSRLNWTGGKLNINNSVTFDSAASGTTTSAAFGATRTVGSGQTLQITGNEALGGAGPFDLTVNSGGTHLVTGNLAVNNTGSLALTNGGMTTVQGALFIGDSITGPVDVAQVDVSGPASTLQSGWLVVGTNQHGILNVSGGGLAQNTTGPVTIGHAATSIGHATVGGENSQLSGKSITVGNFGQGSLTVESGGLAAGNQDPGFVSILVGENSGAQGNLVVESGGAVTATTVVSVGYDAGSTGLVTLHGTLQATTSVQVGRFGTGTMDINGGSVTAGQFVVGAGVDSTGTVTIDGATSSVTVQGIAGPQALNLAVGQRGDGTLTMTNSASASAPVVSIGQYPEAMGQATIGSGATLRALNYFGVGTAFNPFSVPPVDVGAAGGDGTLIVNSGGSAQADATLLIGDNGTIDLTGEGTMTVGDIGMLVPSPASILVGSGGTVKGTGLIKGAVVNSSGTMSPGFSPGALHIEGNYTQASEGMLLLELASASSYDVLDSTGSMTLGGTLLVNTLGMYSPMLGTTFDILNFTTATPFTTVTLPPLAGGLAWNTSLLYTSGVISVVGAGLSGDFNEDGAVDAADYVLWRKNDGSPTGYTAWRSHFGSPLGSGTLASALYPNPIPEPATVTLIALGSAVVLLQRRQNEIAKGVRTNTQRLCSAPFFPALSFVFRAHQPSRWRALK